MIRYFHVSIYATSVLKSGFNDYLHIARGHFNSQRFKKMVAKDLGVEHKNITIISWNEMTKEDFKEFSEKEHGGGG